MGVRDADGKFLVTNAAVFEVLENFRAHGGRDDAVVDGNQNGGMFAVGADGKCFGEDMLDDAVTFGFAREITIEADGIIGSDVDFGNADDECLVVGAE
jgi:hypothetical protein